MQVSVIMATYNRRHLLPELLQQWKAVDEHTKYKYELIFSDDGSPDDTVEFLKSYTELPLVVLENQHSGAANARNHAYQVAKGELIIFTGDDIFPQQDFVNRHYEYFLEHGSKLATLGRIDWRPGIKMTYLMEHITEVGCEQFGFAALPPYSIIDFRHFYTSNISVAKSELDSLGCLFDSAFTKCNFEDIELGYRLWKKGVDIFYAPDITVFHDHVYDSAKKFIQRQTTAGEQLAVFQDLHPGMTQEEIQVDIEGFRAGLEFYMGSKPFDAPGRLGALVLWAMRPTTGMLEGIIQKRPFRKAKQLCSFFYHALFQAHFFIGLGRGLAKTQVHDAEIKRFAIHYLAGGSSQVFFAKDGQFSEDASRRVRQVSGSHVRHTVPVTLSGIRTVRFDPLDSECKIEDLKVRAIQADGSMADLSILHSNGRDNSDFTGIGDPCIVFTPTDQDIAQIEISCRLDQMFSKKARRFAGRGLRFAWQCLKKSPALFGGSPSDGPTVSQSGRLTAVSEVGAPAGKVWLRVETVDQCLLEQYRQACEPLFPSVVVSANRCVWDEYRPYTYSPSSAESALAPMQFLNAASALAYEAADFIVFSSGLDEYPAVYGKSLNDVLIFSSAYPDGGTFAASRAVAAGKFMRVHDPEHCATLLDGEEILPGISCAGLNRLGRGPKKEPPAMHPEPRRSPVAKSKPLVFVLPTFMAVGGVERNTVEVIRRLNHKYDFVTITFERHTKSHGTLFHQLNGLCKAYYDLAEISEQDRYLEIIGALKEAFAPDNVWVPNANPWYFDNLPAIRSIFSDVPMVSQDVYDYEVGWIMHYDRPGAKSYDRYIAINRKIMEAFKTRYGIDGEKIDLVYPAIDPDKPRLANSPSFDADLVRRKYGLKPDIKCFAFVGRVTEQKQPLKFIELAERAARQYDDVEFVMVGNGDLNDEVERAIAQSAIKDKIHRILYIEQMFEFIKSVDALVLTSIYEGLPIVSIEAMCVGTPVVTTDVGDLKLFVEDSRIGLVSPSYEMDDIWQTFQSFYENLDSYKQNAAKAVDKHIEFFSIDRAAEKMDSCFAESGLKYPRRGAGTSPSRTGGQPLVSVVIPSYNHEKYIQAAVDSVLSQTYHNLELIVIDDGSTDNSLEILGRVRDRRYRLIQQENRGAHNAINRGLALADGQYLAILNSDDRYKPERLHYCVDFLAANPEVDLVATYIELIDDKGRPGGIKEGWKNMEPWPQENKEDSYSAFDDFTLNLVASNFVATTSNMVFTAELYRRIGGMRNLRYAHDWDFLFRACQSGLCRMLQTPLVQYRTHGSNTISQGRRHMLFEICWMYAVHLIPLAGRLFPADTSEPDSFRWLHNSTNLQGNDKVVWEMMVYLMGKRLQSVAAPEEILLEDARLREEIMQLITQ